MRNLSMLILALAGIMMCSAEPPPVVGGYAGGNVIAPGYGVPAGGYGVPAHGHGVPVAGYGAPVHGHGGGGHYQQPGLLRQLGSALFGSIAQYPGVKVGHGQGGYGGALSHFNGGKHGGGYPPRGAGLNGLPIPTGHDNNPWRPIKSPLPILSKPIVHAPAQQYGPVVHAPAQQYGPVVQQQYGPPQAAYGVPGGFSHSHSQSRVSITPSLSYGYSYKLVPTFAYGPTLSGGPGYGR